MSRNKKSAVAWKSACAAAVCASMAAGEPVVSEILGIGLHAQTYGAPGCGTAAPQYDPSAGAPSYPQQTYPQQNYPQDAAPGYGQSYGVPQNYAPPGGNPPDNGAANGVATFMGVINALSQAAAQQKAEEAARRQQLQQNQGTQPQYQTSYPQPGYAGGCGSAPPEAYGQPSYGPPQYQQPTSYAPDGAAPYGQAQYGQPQTPQQPYASGCGSAPPQAYGQPDYTQPPAYGQPANGQPQYQQPAAPMHQLQAGDRVMSGQMQGAVIRIGGPADPPADRDCYAVHYDSAVNPGDASWFCVSVPGAPALLKLDARNRPVAEVTR